MGSMRDTHIPHLSPIRRKGSRMMAAPQPTTRLEGIVTHANPKGIRLDGAPEWLNVSRFRPVELPPVGARVAVDVQADGWLVGVTVLDAHSEPQRAADGLPSRERTINQTSRAQGRCGVRGQPPRCQVDGRAARGRGVAPVGADRRGGGGLDARTPEQSYPHCSGVRPATRQQESPLVYAPPPLPASDPALHRPYKGRGRRDQRAPVFRKHRERRPGSTHLPAARWSEHAAHSTGPVLTMWAPLCYSAHRDWGHP